MHSGRGATWFECGIAFCLIEFCLWICVRKLVPVGFIVLSNFTKPVKCIHLWRDFKMNFYFLFLSVVLEGEEIEKEHCLLEFMKGKGVKLDPISTLCWVNGVAISQATKLNQGKECFTKLSTCFSERFSLSISNLWIHDKSRRTRKYCLYSCKRPLRRPSHWWSQARKSAGKRVAGVKRGKTDDRQVLPSAGTHAICFKGGKKFDQALEKSRNTFSDWLLLVDEDDFLYSQAT